MSRRASKRDNKIKGCTKAYEPIAKVVQKSNIRTENGTLRDLTSFLEPVWKMVTLATDPTAETMHALMDQLQQNRLIFFIMSYKYKKLFLSS